MLMLRVSGLISGYESHVESNQWTDLCELYHQYQDNSFDGPANIFKFRAAIKELQLYVLQKADVIVTTLSNCADPSLAEKFQPRLVFVDEAARVTEVDITHNQAHPPPPAARTHPVSQRPD